MDAAKRKRDRELERPDASALLESRPRVSLVLTEGLVQSLTLEQPPPIGGRMMDSQMCYAGDGY